MIYGTVFMTTGSRPRKRLLDRNCYQDFEVTGGTSFTINNPNDLAQAAKAVGTMLRNQYLLDTVPSVNRD